METTELTEVLRLGRFVELNTEAADRPTLEQRHGQVWDPAELRRDFTPIGYMAPIVVVRRIADGVEGSLEFQHEPRFYFNWKEYRQMEDTPSPLCTYCGGPLDEEEAESPNRDEAGKIMCDECYSDHYEYLCPLCQNLAAIDGNQEHIIVTPALADDQRMQPGVYRVIAWPWFTSNHFSMRIHQHALSREADLPATASDMVDGDYVCEHCVGSLTGTSKAEAGKDEPSGANEHAIPSEA